MNLHHFLLISNQDSAARLLVPNVLPQDQLSLASGAFEALTLMRDVKLDAVLVEFDEQDQDAAVMCKTLRRQSNLPIVMLVNRATLNQVTRGYRLGADAHIEMPCDARIFRARMEAILRERSSRVEHKTA